MTCGDPTKIMTARLEESSVDYVDIGDTLFLFKKSCQKGATCACGAFHTF